MKKIFLLLGICFCFMSNANAASNPYPKYEETIFGGQIINCTWYAWEQAHTKAGVDLPLWTYVETWYSKAEKAGYSVGKEPKPNSIMVWDYGEGFGGHVAYVTSVNGDTVIFNEGGSLMTESGIYEGNSFTMDEMSSFLVGFIYLDNVPQKTEETTKQETTTSTVKETVKSSNNYLSDLVISNIDIDFNRETLNYNYNVQFNIQNITIEATTEDKKASITGTGTFSLIDGENNFTITVTAEDKSTREYHIIITREEQEIISITAVPETPKEQKLPIKKLKIITITTISIISALITLEIIIIIKNKFSPKRNSRN